MTVQTAPAERRSISQFVTAEAVVFPLKQATVSPNITSTITDFKVQRGSRVKKGQLLAILENKDLAAQAEASQGDFAQADANYAITVNAGVPQQIQKAELDAAAAKNPRLRLRRKSSIAAKISFSKERFRDATSTARTSH